MSIRVNGKKILNTKRDKEESAITTEDIARVNQASNTEMIEEPNEIREAMREVNRDDLDTDSRMSSIDMRARLAGIELSSILAVDTLVGLEFLPVDCLNFTRQKKRLSVSLAGKGREELIQIVRGVAENETDKNQSIGGKLKSFFNLGGQ